MTLFIIGSILLIEFVAGESLVQVMMGLIGRLKFGLKRDESPPRPPGSEEMGRSRA